MSRPLVLFIVHEYPPIPSAGAQRALKFAAYLPEHGYDVAVLTTGRYGALPTDHLTRVYRADDFVHALFRPLRRGREVAAPQDEQHRVATFTRESLAGRLRDRLMVPDTKLGWLLPAVKLGTRLAADLHPVALFSSSPPETAHLIAGRISRATGIPWVADLRDGWLFEPPNPGLRNGAIRRRIESRLEGGMVAGASAITAATEPLAADLRDRYPAAQARVQAVSNGYDAAEFDGLARQRQADGTFLLVHTGALGASRQGTSPEPFFAALAAHVRTRPDTPLRVRLVGDARPEEPATASALGLDGIVTFQPPVSRREAHQHQLDADALLLITAPGQRTVASLKLFDYIGAGVPVLALAACNAAAEIVARYDLGVCVAPDDPAAIQSGLERMMDLCQQGAAWPGFAAAQQRFTRRALAGELARVIDGIVREARRA